MQYIELQFIMPKVVDAAQFKVLYFRLVCYKYSATVSILYTVHFSVQCCICMYAVLSAEAHQSQTKDSPQPGSTAKP